jgi:hypothetical protein
MSKGLTLLDGLEPSPRAARAHAMKNCVSVIIALCRLAERGAAGPNRERWTRLHSTSERLRQLLADEIAAELGNDTTKPSAMTDLCNVEALVKSVTERLQPRAEGSWDTAGRLFRRRHDRGG